MEVYYNGRWGSICNDGWDEYEANIVCRQLGFDTSALADFGEAEKNTILLDNVICSSSDRILASCGHYGVGIRVGCNNRNTYYKVAGVKCYGEYWNAIFIMYVCILNILRYPKIPTSNSN